MNGRKQLCVYTHSANGRVFYVGQGTRFRRQSRNSRSHAWKAQVKAAGSYDVSIVHWTDDRDEAVRIESELIAAHPSTCNIEKYDRSAFPKSVAIAKVEIRLSASLVAAIDEWRRHLPDLPPRAEAVVRLVEMSLETVAKKTPEYRPESPGRKRKPK